MWSADDKFFGASLITKLGVVSPKTVLLPNKGYVPGIVPGESLRNLRYPLNWDEIARYIGMPCILKDAHGGGWKEVHVCHTVEELIRKYDESGLLTMIVQEFVQWEQFVRCLCLGQEDVLVMQYDPRVRRYIVDEDYLTPALRDRIARDCRTICSALGYDMNSLEYAIKDGVPYAIDFMNCAPDMDIYSLTPTYFEWAVQHMADMAIKLANAPRRTSVEAKWSALFTAAR
jgi:biotin carboxylase